MNEFKGLIFTILSIIVIGFVLYFAPKSEVKFGPVDVDGGSILVGDQNNLQEVVLDTTLTAPGFISIHKSIGEAPGDIIGVSDYLSVGEYKNLVIPLNGEMTSGLKYITLLHIDDGNKIFDIQKDMPVKVDGEVVRPDFTVLSTEVDN